MDDLFQYLIYGILIFSFLSSFFKKKGPTKQNPLPRERETDSISYQQKSTSLNSDVAVKKNEEYDILRELENMFKGNLKIPDQPKPKQVESSDIYSSSEIKDMDLDLIVDKRMQRSVQDQKPVGSRKTYDRNTSYKYIPATKQVSKVDSKIEEGAKEFESVLASSRIRKAAITEFNRKLKNPRTVREYILFSEILGKPKALRR
ncbi:MAG: hypothetical protein IPJ23_07890 [Ignavibacteriales bacterium]|nr:hypothetical protein [Ignavibacteriales bacterium]